MSIDISSDSAKRLNYHDGMFLTSALMSTEQSYFLTLSQLQNQMCYTPGVLEGMEPVQQNNNVQVSSGGGIDENGHFLIFPGGPIAITSSNSSPCAVYAVYPQASNAGNVDVLNMAATLQVGDVGSPLEDSVIIAQVSHTNGTITDVVDKRQPVTSKLPAKITSAVTEQSEERLVTQTSKVQSTTKALHQSLHGTMAISADEIMPKGKSKSFDVYYLAGQGAAFTTAPQVVITPQFVSASNTEINSAGSLSVMVSNTDNHKFTATITTVNSLADSITSIDLNWLAFTKGV